MARPKRIEGEPTARQRMEDAFWGMLADMPYHKMTSREVCKRSGVSHNSFYYHFENLDDMARQMLNGLFVPERPPRGWRASPTYSRGFRGCGSSSATAPPGSSGSCATRC